MNNTISVIAYIITGDTNEILIDVKPKEAIEKYFMPDMRPPVQTLVIKATTNDGKEVTLSISNSTINASIK